MTKIFTGFRRSSKFSKEGSRVTNSAKGGVPDTYSSRANY